MRHLARALLMIAATTAAAEMSRAQLGAEGPAADARSAHIVLENAQGLSSDLIGIIAGGLHPRLPDWPDSVPLSATSVDITAKIGSLGENGQIGQLYVNVAGHLEPTDAEFRQLLEIARAQLEAELNRITQMVAETQRRRIRSDIDRLHAYGSPGDQIEELIEQLAEWQGKSAGAEGNFSEGVGEAFSKQRELQLRDAGLQARREAIERRIDETRATTDVSAKADAIVRELAKVVEIREKTRQRLQEIIDNQAGAITQGDLLEADAHLAQARIDLLKSERDAEERAGGGALRALNDELSKLLIESAEIDAQRKKLEQIISDIRSEFRDMARAIAQADSLKAQIKVLRKQQIDYDANIIDLKRQLDELAPQPVTLRPLTVDQRAADEPEASAPGASE